MFLPPINGLKKFIWFILFYGYFVPTALPGPKPIGLKCLCVLFPESLNQSFLQFVARNATS